MEYNEQTGELIQPKRPDMLKVLCILSFIGLGIVFLISLASIPKLFQTPEMRMAEMEQMEQISPGYMDKMAPIMTDPNYTVKAVGKLIFDLLFQVLSLIGVIQMWKLRKKGFYFYLAGELLPYLSMLLFFDQGMGMLNNLPGYIANIAYVMMGLMVAIDLLFIFLYSRNLKHMH